MAAKKFSRTAALKRWVKSKKTRQLIPIVSKHYGPERGRRVAVGLRAWALGISISQLAKRGARARRKKGRRKKK